MSTTTHNLKGAIDMAETGLIDPADTERFLREVWGNAGEEGLDPAEQQAALISFGAWHAQRAVWELWKQGRVSLAWTGRELGVLLPEEEANR